MMPPPAPRPEPERVPEPGQLHALRPWAFAPTDWGPCRTFIETSPMTAPVFSPDFAALLGDPRLAGFTPEDALYLDIEATGLSHGAGTLAFLIGAARIERGQVVLEQLFLTDPTEEMAVLGRCLELLESRPYLVSFNGKSYDLSVLQARLIITRHMSRMEAGLKLRPHLDLLHVSRHAYRGLFPDGRLQTLEREVLRLDPSVRADDVPGSLVPTLYFHYLQTGYAPPLDVVLTHNRTDVLSMVSLTAHLCALFDDPSPSTPAPILANLGRHAMRKKLHARAERLLTRAAAEGAPDVADDLARVQKRIERQAKRLR